MHCEWVIQNAPGNKKQTSKIYFFRFLDFFQIFQKTNFKFLNFFYFSKKKFFVHFWYLFLRWKELFPELMKLLGDMPKIIVQNEVKTGSEFCDSQIKNLLASRWPETVLSSIGAMFL